jgi:hypothetical protein
MNRNNKLRAQIALTTAICFASLATFAVHTPAASEARSCDPWRAISWGGSDCR